MVRIKFLSVVLATLILTGALAIAQPLGLKTNIPEGAIRAVQKYMPILGKSRIEQIERLGNSTFLFVVRVKNQETLGGEDIIHYIITTRYKTYRIISDNMEKKF